jgi:hypothetical protein
MILSMYARHRIAHSEDSWGKSEDTHIDKERERERERGKGYVYQ